MALIESQVGFSTAAVRSALIRAMFDAVAISPAGDWRTSFSVRSGWSRANRAATQAPSDMPMNDACSMPSASSRPSMWAT